MDNRVVITNFLNEICLVFPEIRPLMEAQNDDLPTSKMEEFANATTRAFANSELSKGKAYLNFMSHKLATATDKEFEYIDVYFVENLFSLNIPGAAETGWPSVPENLKNLYLKFHRKPPL